MFSFMLQVHQVSQVQEGHNHDHATNDHSEIGSNGSVLFSLWLVVTRISGKNYIFWVHLRCSRSHSFVLKREWRIFTRHLGMLGNLHDDTMTKYMFSLQLPSLIELQVHQVSQIQESRDKCYFLNWIYKYAWYPIFQSHLVYIVVFVFIGFAGKDSLCSSKNLIQTITLHKRKQHTIKQHC